MAARSAASENETGPVVDSGIAASGRIAPEAARETQAGENPAGERGAPEDPAPAAGLVEQEMEAREESGQNTGSKGEIAWRMMLDENYLSQNALMDMDMTRYARDTWFLSTNKKELPVLNTGMSYPDFREGLSRWRNKYPDSAGFREIEEHLDWIESVAKSEGQELFQDENKSNSEPWQQKLQKDVAAWEKTVDDFMAGRFDSRKSVTILYKTPLVLSLFGADKDKRVITDYSKLVKILKDKHKLSEDVLKQVPKAMADPLMVFESATVKGDYVMMLDLKDEQGSTVVVPVSLDYDMWRGYIVNYAPSIYAKNKRNLTPQNGWFVTQIENGNLRYINNKKSRQWASSSRLQLPRVGTHLNGKRKIFTEADLVKLREQYNSEYYHGEDGHRGSVQIYPEYCLIRLLEKADLYCPRGSAQDAAGY